MTCLKIALLAGIGVFAVGAISMHHEIGYIMAGVALLVGLLMLIGKRDEAEFASQRRAGGWGGGGGGSNDGSQGRRAEIDQFRETLPSKEAFAHWYQTYDQYGTRTETKVYNPAWRVLSQDGEDMGITYEDHENFIRGYWEAVDQSTNADREGHGLPPLPYKTSHDYAADDIVNRYERRDE